MYRGGDGVIRDIEFLEAGVQVSILSERRVFRPYGLEGGEDGEAGLNLWIRKHDQIALNLSGKNSVPFGKGDRIVINTPGGGGYGSAHKRRKINGDTRAEQHPKASGSLAAYKAMSESA